MYINFIWIDRKKIMESHFTSLIRFKGTSKKHVFFLPIPIFGTSCLSMVVVYDCKISFTVQKAGII